MTIQTITPITPIAIDLPSTSQRYAEAVAAYFGARVVALPGAHEVRLGDTLLCTVRDDWRVTVAAGSTGGSLVDAAVAAFSPRTIEDDPREVAEAICRAGLVPAWLILAVGPDTSPEEWAGHGDRVVVVHLAEVVSGTLPPTRVPGGSLGATLVAEQAERLRISAGVDRLEIWTTGGVYWTTGDPEPTDRLLAA